jgi:hypothetical protein
MRSTRWLDENGRLSVDPTRALRLVSPEVAARRLQAYLQLHGWPIEATERFRIVPAPVRPSRSWRGAGGREDAAA